MNQRCPLLTLAVCSIFFMTVSASAAKAEVLSLEKAIEIAQAQSPEVRNGEEQYDSARAKRRLALMPSEPTFSLSFNDMTAPFYRASAASRVYQLTQPIGFPGRAVLNSSMLGDSAEASRLQMEALRHQVSVNVKQAYYGLALARKNIALNADLKANYEQILAVAKRRYENGAITQVDYLNAQVALIQNENDLTDLRSAERAARAQLNVLLKRSTDTEVEVEPVQMTLHPEISKEEAARKMLENRVEVRVARAQLNASEKARTLAWMSILPDFQLIAGQTFYDVHSASPYSSTPDATASGVWPTRTYMVGVQFTVPIWGLFNEREVIVGASHDLSLIHI